MKVDVSTLKEDIGKLKSQIVESPEELKSQMEKMRENVKSIKISIVKTDGAFLQKKVTDPEITGLFLCVLPDYRKTLTSAWWSCRTWSRA